MNKIYPPTARIGDGMQRATAKDLRQLADQARSRRDFVADTFYRRLICEIEEGRAGNWIQYGHALKEAGFHARSEKAYRRALEIVPGDADLYLQLGHLAKVRGNFDDATAWLHKALEADHPRRDDILSQLGLLKKIDNAIVFREASSGGDLVPYRVFLSVPGGAINEGDRPRMQAGLGHGDYSYAFAMRGFANALEALEIDYTIVEHPEYVYDIRQRSNAEHNIHLSFYPPERLRLLKGAYNINCFAWEFDRLRSPHENLSSHAFSDQARMLDLADEIWMPSEHGIAAVSTQVSRPVRLVPAPITENQSAAPRAGRPAARQKEKAIRSLSQVAWQPLAIVPRIQQQINDGAQAREMRLQSIVDSQYDGELPTIFVSVFNAHDYRKQICPMIRGFVEFIKTNPNALLILKVTTVDKLTSVSEIIFREQMMSSGELTPPLVSEKVWVTRQVLTREEMNALYDVCDHYICTSHAEGQNLPLIEAMARGAVPVSVAGTAMDAYISEQTAEVIEAEKKPFGSRLTARYGLFGLETYFTSPEAVRKALQRSVDLDHDVYAAKSSAAWERVGQLYGLEHFARVFQDLLNRLGIKAEIATS